MTRLENENCPDEIIKKIIKDSKRREIIIKNSTQPQQDLRIGIRFSRLLRLLGQGHISIEDFYEGTSLEPKDRP